MEMKNVYAAFVKAQRGFAPALKTSTNPHFKSKYADLAACVEAVLDSLNENGIGLIQRTHQDESGVTVETVFIHESGETLSGGTLHVPASKQDPQGYGSALSYARRYSLMAACGIAPEDDDGNAASKKAKPVNDSSGFDSAPKAFFKMLPKDWQEYLQSIAPKIDNAFEQAGAGAALDLIEAETLDNDCRAGLESLLSSKTRSGIKKEQEARKVPA